MSACEPSWDAIATMGVNRIWRAVRAGVRGGVVVGQRAPRVLRLQLVGACCVQTLLLPGQANSQQIRSLSCSGSLRGPRLGTIKQIPHCALESWAPWVKDATFLQCLQTSVPGRHSQLSLLFPHPSGAGASVNSCISSDRQCCFLWV